MAVVGLGKKDAGVCGAENWDISKENIRQAVSGKLYCSASLSSYDCKEDVCDLFFCPMVICFSKCVFSGGCQLLQDLELNHVEVDSCGDAQSAAEGAALGLFHYDQLKSKKKTKVTLQLHGRYVNEVAVQLN